MNSLENLNNWSNDDILYAGDAVYSITFSPTSPVNQTTSVIEDQAFVSPVGTNITSMVSTPRNIQYTIDLSGIALAATIDWGTLPYFITSEIAGTNIFRLVGPIDENVWAQVKSPSITIIDQATTFTYPATITYPDPTNTANDLTKTWNVTVSITASPNITSPTATQYLSGLVGTLSGTPQITNSAAGTYSILITPSLPGAIYTLSSAGSGGTSVFDPVYKTLTLSGTKTQVNSHLTSIKLTTVSGETRAFTLEYRLTNPSGLINTVTQNFSVTEPFVINTATYVEDTPFALGYVIKDASATATNFTISVAQTTPLPNVSIGYFTVNGSNVGNTWTASDTRGNINAANVIYTPPIDYTGTITMTVNQSKVDEGNSIVQVVNQPVNIINAGTNNEVSNMIARSYQSNVVTSIFAAQTPSINDGSDIGQTYTITLASSLGKFGNSAANAIASASYSFTGNMSSTNSEFSNMVFLPNVGSASTGTFTYTQSRSGIGSQVNTSLGLTGTNFVPTPVIYTFTGNTTFTPTFSQFYFGNTQILVAGGGGGGGGGNTYIGSGAYAVIGGGGGGGGGVVVANIAPNTYLSGTYTITVGTGGLYRDGHTDTTSSLTHSNGGNGTSSLATNGIASYGAGGGLGGLVSATSSQSKGGASGNGNAGGFGANFQLGGGGGGAGGIGGNAVANTSAGLGGGGISNSISGGSVSYGQGGRGGTGSPGNTGANGSTFGSGGGGGGATSSSTGNGAQGVVIIKIS